MLVIICITLYINIMMVQVPSYLNKIMFRFASPYLLNARTFSRSQDISLMIIFIYIRDKSNYKDLNLQERRK